MTPSTPLSEQKCRFCGKKLVKSLVNKETWCGNPGCAVYGDSKITQTSDLAPLPELERIESSETSND